MWSPPSDLDTIRTAASGTDMDVRPNGTEIVPAVDQKGGLNLFVYNHFHVPLIAGVEHADMRGSMLSLEQRYAVLTATARKLGHDPDPEQLQRLRTELDELDRERDDVPAGERRYRLSLASGAANSCLTEAVDRARGVRGAAAAAVERERNDARHPTVLSPRSALADWQPGKPRDRGIER